MISPFPLWISWESLAPPDKDDCFYGESPPWLPHSQRLVETCPTQLHRHKDLLEQMWYYLGPLSLHSLPIIVSAWLPLPVDAMWQQDGLWLPQTARVLRAYDPREGVFFWRAGQMPRETSDWLNLYHILFHEPITMTRKIKYSDRCWITYASLGQTAWTGILWNEGGGHVPPKQCWAHTQKRLQKIVLLDCSSSFFSYYLFH